MNNADLYAAFKAHTEGGKVMRFSKNEKVRVVAQDSDEGTAQVGDLGSVIGHEGSEACVLVQFDGFTEWLWNYEVEPLPAAPKNVGGEE